MRVSRIDCSFTHITPQGDGNFTEPVCDIVGYTCFTPITPQGDGNFQIRIGCSSAKMPCFTPITPQGDGNAEAETSPNCNARAVVSHPLPRKGTETLFTYISCTYCFAFHTHYPARGRKPRKYLDS